jgi:hypothetical protein
MTWEFLFFANLALLLRLRLLLADLPPPPTGWWSKAAIEVVAFLLVLDVGPAQGAAMAASLVVSAAAVFCDRRFRDRNAIHLLLGAVQLVALSFCLGPNTGVAVRPWLTRALGGLTQASALGSSLRDLSGVRGLRFVLGLLLAANEANLFIRWILNRLQLRPGAINAGIDANEYARGRVIGLLERILIYFFVLNGQYGAVGFTLAAKGFTRFKELENRSFAEYVLIGTLLSSGLAMLIAVAIRNLH